MVRYCISWLVGSFSQKRQLYLLNLEIIPLNAPSPLCTAGRAVRTTGGCRTTASAGGRDKFSKHDTANTNHVTNSNLSAFLYGEITY